MCTKYINSKASSKSVTFFAVVYERKLYKSLLKIYVAVLHCSKYSYLERTIMCCTYSWLETGETQTGKKSFFLCFEIAMTNF